MKKKRFKKLATDGTISKQRMLVIFSILLLLFFGLIGRLLYVSIYQGISLKTKATEQWTSQVTIDAKREIVEIAALLHDYAGIKDQRMAEEHHIYAAAEAQRILIEFNYPKDRIQKVKDCIITHRGSVPMKRLTQEAECIASADAMTHVFQVPSLLYLAYVTHGMEH